MSEVALPRPWANYAGPEQTAPEEQSVLGLHCLLKEAVKMCREITLICHQGMVQ